MEADMTEFLDVAGGRIAYDVTGEGPPVVLSHGIGDRRQAYRFLAPKLAQAGYRVANADLRGHGESSMGWSSVTGKAAITRTDIAGDLLALIRHLGGPAGIVWTSISREAPTSGAPPPSSSGTPSGAGPPPSPRPWSRNWSAASSRSTRSPRRRRSAWAACCGSGGTGGA